MISTPVKADAPRIAIIGRPNVGKSTLYNRLIGKRKAITDPTPGVTRDALEAPFELDGRAYCLVDTGGLTTDAEGYGPVISARALSVADKADLILLVVDVNNVDNSDLEFIEKLRKYSKKIIFVANKVDHPEKEDLVWNLHSYGFERVVSVSAEHGRNIVRLRNEIASFFRELEKSVGPAVGADSDVSGENDPESAIRIAILGKPNTGKSTLTNILLGEEKSIVSDIPGTTRDTIEGTFVHEGRLFHVIDTAGIRRKTKVTDNVEYYSVNRAIDSIRSCDVALLLIDSVDGISDQDKKIAALIEKQGKGIIIVLSKWDLLPDVPNRLNAVKDKIRFIFPVLSFAPILPLSSHTRMGVDKILSTVRRIRRELVTRIDTGRLNRALETWVSDFSVKVKGKPVKVHYMTQVSADPVKFVCFINREKGLRGEYEQYLKNRIRRDFGLEHIPISVEFRLREQKPRPR